MGIAITNARVFDGRQTLDPQTVYVEDDRIVAATQADATIDGTGCTLLPGLIDSHVHLYEKTSYLKMAIDCGVTTMLDMGIRNPEVVDHYRELPGLPSMLSSCGIIFAPGSAFINKMEFPADMMCKGIDDVQRIVDDRINAGADYIKVIFEGDPRNEGNTAQVDEQWEFPPDVGRAIVDYAHERGLKVCAHATSVNAYRLALMIGIDVIMHMPYTEPMPQTVIDDLAASDAVVVPTMAMGEGLMGFIKQQILGSVPEGTPAETLPPMPSIDLSVGTLSRMLEAGVKILAGSDANLDDPTTPADVVYGKALQDDLRYYVQAGMTPSDALAHATSIPAAYWGLEDRGTIAVGKLADLLLVRGAPDQNISDIQNVKAVIKRGKPVELS